MRQQPTEIIRVELAEPFDGWWADVDMDLDLGTLEDLQSGDVTRITDALPRLITGWNFVDKRGEALSCDAAGARRLGKALLTAFMTAFNGAITVPNA